MDRPSSRQGRVDLLGCFAVALPLGALGLVLLLVVLAGALIWYAGYIEEHAPPDPGLSDTSQLLIDDLMRDTVAIVEVTAAAEEATAEDAADAAPHQAGRRLHRFAPPHTQHHGDDLQLGDAPLRVISRPLLMGDKGNLDPNPGDRLLLLLTKPLTQEPEVAYGYNAWFTIAPCSHTALGTCVYDSNGRAWSARHDGSLLFAGASLASPSDGLYFTSQLKAALREDTTP